ncbi:hypothetical protein, partial [Mycobacterium sp. NAZ190054]|uniref:hypothetical protein n=1 Tax=Mycobacterium sp. NAZ190054 TaxID=1747766 RepID=UPI001E420AD8
MPAHHRPQQLGRPRAALDPDILRFGPFRGEVERLGRLVFGDSSEVDGASSLRPGSRPELGAGRGRGLGVCRG